MKSLIMLLSTKSQGQERELPLMGSDTEHVEVFTYKGDNRTLWTGL